jgi:hypothetical protein
MCTNVKKYTVAMGSGGMINNIMVITSTLWEAAVLVLPGIQIILRLLLQ